MIHCRCHLVSFLLAAVALLTGWSNHLPLAWAADVRPAEGQVVKAVLDASQAGPNLVKTENLGSYERGFQKDGPTFLCDNGKDAKGQRGVAFGLTLNQTRP